eukprot:TRINITY_DN749_c0_g1_i12.p6 TRINITY_DN749_c0_g1~~TRINITY_DN749_c0_g1_i12.p6  ORF type:complete len:113 (-),score=11.91 TRINITY_DN749_c0_g1_i12:747-1085(-)
MNSTVRSHRAFVVVVGVCVFFLSLLYRLYAVSLFFLSPFFFFILSAISFAVFFCASPEKKTHTENTGKPTDEWSGRTKKKEVCFNHTHTHVSSLCVCIGSVCTCVYVCMCFW